MWSGEWRRNLTHIIMDTISLGYFRVSGGVDEDMPARHYVIAPIATEVARSLDLLSFLQLLPRAVH